MPTTPFWHDHVIQDILDWQHLRKPRTSSQEESQLQYKVLWHPVKIEKWTMKGRKKLV